MLVKKSSCCFAHRYSEKSFLEVDVLQLLSSVGSRLFRSMGGLVRLKELAFQISVCRSILSCMNLRPQNCHRTLSSSPAPLSKVGSTLADYIFSVGMPLSRCSLLAVVTTFRHFARCFTSSSIGTDFEQCLHSIVKRFLEFKYV